MECFSLPVLLGYHGASQLLVDTGKAKNQLDAILQWLDFTCFYFYVRFSLFNCWCSTVQVRSLLGTSEHLAKLCSAQSCTQFDHPLLDYDKDVSLRDYDYVREMDNSIIKTDCMNFVRNSEINLNHLCKFMHADDMS